VPAGMKYGMTKVKVDKMRSLAKAIPPKGLPTSSNGAPWREKKSPLPPSNSKPDMGAARGGTKAPKMRPDKSKKVSANLKGQMMRERGKGFSKA